MKHEDLLGMSHDELLGHLEDYTRTLSDLRFNHHISPIENPARIRLLRRDIARLNTELRRREMEKTQA